MELVEIMVHSSYTAVYAHIIVVQDDENVVRGRRSIVQSFESQTATHRTVADDGNDVPSFFILIGRGHRHAQSGGDGIGSMSAGERVVFAFGRRGERFQPVQLPVGRETFPASCQYLMAVCLMSDIPYDAVVRRVVHIMQSDRQLHDA